MSGPIIRKYGFPNFEKIFGERGLQHGVDAPDEPSDVGGKGTNPGEKGETQGPSPTSPEARPGRDDSSAS